MEDYEYQELSILYYKGDDKIEDFEFEIAENTLETKPLQLILHKNYKTHVFLLILVDQGVKITLSCLVLNSTDRNYSIKFFDSTKTKHKLSYLINKNFIIGCLNFLRPKNISFVSKPSKYLVFPNKENFKILESEKLNEYWEKIFNEFKYEKKIKYECKSDIKNIKKLKKIDLFEDRIELKAARYMAYKVEEEENYKVFNCDLFNFFRSFSLRKDFNSSTLYYYNKINKYPNSVSQKKNNLLLIDNLIRINDLPLDFIKTLDFKTKDQNIRSTNKILNKFHIKNLKTFILELEKKKEEEEIFVEMI